MDSPPAHALALLVADVYECAGALRRVGDELAARAGQTQARWQLLSVRSEGGWTAATAARRLGVSRQAVQQVADALQRDGLLRPEPNPRHRGSPLLRLTPAGRRALRSIAPGAAAWHDGVAAALRADDLEATRRTLRALVDLCARGVDP
jgi:DNA-binding MarR family transcriptional regulator